MPVQFLQMLILMLKWSHNVFCMCSFGPLAEVGRFGVTLRTGLDTAEKRGSSQRTGTSSPIVSRLQPLVQAPVLNKCQKGPD